MSSARIPSFCHNAVSRTPLFHRSISFMFKPGRYLSVCLFIFCSSPYLYMRLFSYLTSKTMYFWLRLCQGSRLFIITTLFVYNDIEFRFNFYDFPLFSCLTTQAVCSFKCMEPIRWAHYSVRIFETIVT